MIALLVCLAVTPVTSPKDEVSAVEELISVTKDKLAEEEKLKKLLLDFRLCRAQFSHNSESKELAFKLVSTARKILEIVKNEHLEHLFPSDYLEEITFFSSIAAKNQPARP